jgi:Holliday junction resolvasome RuvABC endonuclease subunit
MRILGLDPGTTGGAWGALRDDGHGLRFVACGDVNGDLPESVDEVVEAYGMDRVVIEKVGAFPGQGVSSTFKFGKAFGTFLGVATARSCQVTLVSPQVWKKKLGLSWDKEESRALALKLYPLAEPFLTRKKDHGRAEAILLAHYRHLLMS